MEFADRVEKPAEMAAARWSARRLGNGATFGEPTSQRPELLNDLPNSSSGIYDLIVPFGAV